MHSRPAPRNQVGILGVAAYLPLGTRKAVYLSSSCNLFIVIYKLTLFRDSILSERSSLPFTLFDHWAECACNPVRPFAILSMQRSGSGWFETLLNNHTNVSSNGEIFSVKERRSNVSSILSTLDRVYNLDWVSSASKNQCSSAVGFKWMLNQGLMEYHKEIVEYFNDRGVSVIFLFRRNLLRRMVSVLANSYDRYAKLLNGMHKSHVHSHEEADKLSSYKPIINSTSLIMDLKQMEKMVLEALEHFSSTRHIILYYEDLIKNRTKLVDVQAFLGLPLMELKSRQIKIHKGLLSEHIKNWDDVNKTLRGTVYESFLHNDYTS
ncbi:UNVERIFIED_CONTAM: hypothetical protein Sradi_3078400 [Sesamum radiatum]|uniref:Sulfotransferase n=1 Tax=Sesamum radiatum TaxID=300843 RepID=A0AAW2RCL8_SESRA